MRRHKGRLAVEKKKRSFNVIDAVMIAAVVAAVAALAYGIISGLGIGRGYVRIKYVIEVPEIRSEFCQKAAVGDVVRSSDGSSALGEVAAVSSVPARHEGTDSDGNAVSSEIDGYSILYVTVEANAQKTDTGYVVGGETLSAGSSLFVRLPSLCFGGECVSVETVENQQSR